MTVTIFGPFRFSTGLKAASCPREPNAVKLNIWHYTFHYRVAAIAYKTLRAVPMPILKQQRNAGGGADVAGALLPFAAVEDLEVVAGVGGEEGGDVAEALG